MKSKIRTAVVILLSVTTVIFAALWICERDDRSDYLRLAQFEASAAYNDFLLYDYNGTESNYWSAVESFYAFGQAYFLYVKGTNREGNYNVINQLCGYMTHLPEDSREHLSEIIEFMSLLDDNVENENAYIKMKRLKNSLMADSNTDNL